MKELEFESVKTAKGTLYTAAAITSRFSVPTEVVNELAASGFMPHHRVRGIEQPLFDVIEAKQWIAENAMQKISGQKLLPPEIVLVKQESSLVGIAPSVIASIPGLRQFHPELFCGVYFLCLSDEVVYVGKSITIPTRIKQHSIQYDRIYFLQTPSEQQQEVENRFIKLLRPRFNTVGNPEKKGGVHRNSATSLQ